MEKGLIGLITAACLPSANEASVRDEERIRRQDRGNSIGGWMCGVNLALSVILLLFALTNV